MVTKGKVLAKSKLKTVLIQSTYVNAIFSEQFYIGYIERVCKIAYPTQMSNNLEIWLGSSTRILFFKIVHAIVINIYYGIKIFSQKDVIKCHVTSYLFFPSTFFQFFLQRYCAMISIGKDVSLVNKIINLSLIVTKKNYFFHFFYHIKFIDKVVIL